MADLKRPAELVRTHGPAVTALIALSLVGLHPFSYTSLASSFDGLLHLYRLVELDHLLAQGILYPRWAPDFLFGFGFPIFNFYAPLAYYGAALIHATGISYADTATIFFVLCTLAASLAMYGLAWELSGNRWGALAAATAYVYAPTHIYDNFYRSAWGTVLAYAIAPCVLGALAEWYRRGRARALVAVALGTASLMLAHNVSALLTMPLVGLALLAFLPLQAEGRAAPRLLPAVAAVACGVGASAFFWWPALAETQFVQTWRLTIPPDFDFRNHFLTIADWVAWSAPAEVGRINPDLVNTLGPVQAVLALIGLGVVAARVVRRGSGSLPRGSYDAIALPAVYLCAVLLLTLPLSRAVWESIPLLPSLQFPHRFLTVAALCAAVLVTGVIASLPARRQAPAALVTCGLLIIAGIPYLYPRPQPLIEANPGLASVLAHERKSGALGTTASGEYLPQWVKFIPRASPFEEAIVNGENPQRFESRSLPAGGKVLDQTAGPLAFSLSITSPQDFTATFRHFYFPGWQGYVDGEPVSTTASDGQGFSTFRVPAGERRIALRFESTPVRDAARNLSIVSVGVGALGFAWMTLRRSNSDSGKAHRAETRSIDALRSHVPFIVAGVALLLLKAGIVDRFDTPLRTSFDGLHAPGLQYPRLVSLGGGISALGYSLLNMRVAPSETFALTVFWSAQHELGEVYSSFAQLVDERNNLYAQKDNLHPGGAPTTTWRPHEYNVDRHPISVPPGTPPGEYWIAVGLYSPASGARMLRDAAATNEPLDQFLIGPVEVLAARAPFAPDAYGIRNPLDHPWASGIRLMGFSSDRERLPADDFLRVALFWRADRARLPALRMRLHLMDAQGRAWAEQQGAPSNERYPTTQWSAGEIVRDSRALWIPRTLPAGDYHLMLQLEGEADVLELGSMRKP